LGVSLAVNILSMVLLKRNIFLIGKIRVAVNYTVSIFLVCLLYKQWPMAWILLLLMALGLAVYQKRKSLSLTAAAISLLLVATHRVFGEGFFYDWARVGVEACTIFILSLFV